MANNGCQPSCNKFHPVFGSFLKVSLETIFPFYSEIKLLGDFDGNKHGLVWQGAASVRIYHPAYADGDVSDKNMGVIDFIPWVDGTEAQGHRLCFRTEVRNKKFSAWVRLARFEEDKVFGFEDPYKPYVNLDFFSKRSDSFVPVYAKVVTSPESTAYLGIEGQASDEGVKLMISRLGLGSVPKILVDSRPQS